MLWIWPVTSLTVTMTPTADDATAPGRNYENGDEYFDYKYYKGFKATKPLSADMSWVASPGSDSLRMAVKNLV